MGCHGAQNKGTASRENQGEKMVSYTKGTACLSKKKKKKNAKREFKEMPETWRVQGRESGSSF